MLPFCLSTNIASSSSGGINSLAQQKREKVLVFQTESFESLLYEHKKKKLKLYPVERPRTR
jgi:hypothetical protein